MNGKNYLLDTNIVVYFLQGNLKARELFNTLEALNIPAIVAGELFFGAYKSSKVEQNLESLLILLETTNILSADQDVAVKYGQIKSALKTKGIPIPENDIWIAAIALHNDFILITNDHHFEKVDGLKIHNLS